jgi:ABC-2 type transport system ATP-binding protein
MATLEINHITKYYSGHTALRDISFSIPAASIYGLLGPNGAGKTSLMRILNRLTLPDDGFVLVDGKPLENKHTRKMGYLPEERGLYRKMSVRAHINYFARLKGMSRIEAKTASGEWMEKFGLTAWSHKRIETLSKGMAQKVQFIITVIHRPEILIMDEPFSGFDPVNAQLIKKELFAMRDAGATILLSTHNMSSVESLCSHITLLNKGENIITGTTREIRERYDTGLYEVEFKGNIIAFTNSLWTGFELVEREQLGNEHFVARLRMLNNNDVNAMLQVTMEFVKIQRVQRLQTAMDEIFISATTEDAKKESHA